MKKSIKTVIVDDEPRIRRGVERLVLSCGEYWEIVGSFSSGKECLEQIKALQLDVDLLITDIKMPEIDGLTLIKELKKMTSFFSIVISGFDDFKYLQTAIREGASDYLIKPIDRSEFREQLIRIKDKMFTQMNQEQEMKATQFKASQLEYVKQIQRLSEVTKGQDLDLSYLEWTKQFPASPYHLMYVSVDNIISKSKRITKSDWKTWVFAIDNIIDEMISTHKEETTLQVWKWRGEELSYWILFQRDKTDKESDFAEQLKENIQTFTPFTCSIAIGEDFEDLTLLPNVINELMTYKQFRLLYGGNRIFSKGFMEHNRKRDMEENDEMKEIESFINRIVISFDSNNNEKTLSEIDQLLNKLQTFEQPEEIEQLIKLLGIRMINHLLKDGGVENEFELIQALFDLSKKTSNYLEFRNEVYEWSKKVLEIVDARSSSQMSDPVAFAKSWIMEHISEKITIPKISSQVYMNPTYFCEYFKKKTGETVLDYVTRVRIEKARELLINSDLKIYDISVQVGYADTKYFSKLFKKVYGETPSKYKEKIMLEKM